MFMSRQGHSEPCMKDDKTPRCQRRITFYIGSWPHDGQCSRSGKIQEGDGEWRCRQHVSKAIAKREREVTERVTRLWDKRLIEIHSGRFHAALVEIAGGHNDPRRLANEVLELITKGADYE